MTIEIGPNLLYGVGIAALVVVILGWFRFKKGGKGLMG